MNLDPGQLRHRVTWQILDQTSLDGRNQPLDQWVSQGTYWANVQPLGGREAVNARQLVATASHKVSLRNVGAIRQSHRLVFEGRTLNIDSVIKVDGRNEWLELLCTEQPTP